VWDADGKKLNYVSNKSENIDMTQIHVNSINMKMFHYTTTLPLAKLLPLQRRNEMEIEVTERMDELAAAFEEATEAYFAPGLKGWVLDEKRKDYLDKAMSLASYTSGMIIATKEKS